MPLRAELPTMDHRYQAYYRSALQEETAFERRTASAFPPVQQAITRANSVLPEGVSLRDDAALLLRINIVEMVLAPLYQVDSARAQEVLTDIESDVGRIVLAAAELSPEREISGHSVIDAVSQRWGQLRMMRPDVWG